MPIFEKFAPRTDSALIAPRRLPNPLGAGVGPAWSTLLISGIDYSAAVSESAAAEGIRVGERLGEIGVRIES